MKNSPISLRSSLSVVSNYAFIISIVLLLSSCAGLNDIEITGVEGFKMRGIENNAVTFAADIGVRNPASVGFKVSEISLKTTIDGNFIGTLSSPDRVKISARSDSTYTMNFSLELANIITSASTLYNLSRKNQVNVVMQGYVRARSGLITKKVDVNETRLMDVPRNFR